MSVKTDNNLNINVKLILFLKIASYNRQSIRRLFLIVEMINNIPSVTLHNEQHSRHYISSVSTRQASYHHHYTRFAIVYVLK